MGVPSPALLDALSSPSATPGDIVQALRGDSPRKLAIGGRVIDAPTSPSDPRGAQAIALVTEELQRHGVPETARCG